MRYQQLLIFHINSLKETSTDEKLLKYSFHFENQPMNKFHILRLVYEIIFVYMIDAIKVKPVSM